jgi:hypothetical protein
LFISHHNIEAGSTIAEIVEEYLERDNKVSRKVFADEEEEGYLDLSQLLLVHLEESQSVVLLLMKDVLHRPHCLLEINHAIVRKIPLWQF